MTITNPAAARRGASLLLAWAAASAGAWLLNLVAFRVLGLAHLSAADALSTLLWLGLDVLLAVAVLSLGAGSDRPQLAWLLVALIALGALMNVGFSLARLLAPDSVGLLGLLSVPSMLVGLAERAAFLVLVVRLCGPERPWALVVAFVAGVVALFRSIVPLALSVRLVDPEVFVSEWYGWLSGGLGLVAFCASFALALGVRAAVWSVDPSTVTRAAPAEPAEGAPSPAADFAIGGALLAAGVGVSVLSFSLASAGSGGGRYVVATGLIGVGLGRLIRGIFRRAKQGA